jgi:catalase (peroxidase I)
VQRRALVRNQRRYRCPEARRAENCKKTSGICARSPNAPSRGELNLLDMATEWKASSTSEGLFEGLDRGTGEIKWTATRVDLVFGFNSQLQAIAEVYASADSKEIFVKPRGIRS